LFYKDCLGAGNRGTTEFVENIFFPEEFFPWPDTKDGVKKPSGEKREPPIVEFFLDPKR
jgi:hypothetical protein